MACYNPLEGHRQPGGSVKIGWEPPGSLELVRVPCGSCLGCRMEYASSWATRLTHEASCWDSNLFITLTYEDEHIPWHGGLELADLQKFMKRIRKTLTGDKEGPDGSRKIRFFAAGEYGSSTARPHWHIALFNTRLPGWSGADRSDCLSRLWTMGMHSVSSFTAARAGYIAGYAVKKARGRLERQRRYGAINPATGEYTDRKPEFCVMSRRPGIGAYWFDRYSCDLQRGFIVEPGGARRRLPRFYKTKLMRDESFAMASEQRTFEYTEGLDPRENTDERRAAHELVHAARLSSQGRQRLF